MAERREERESAYKGPGRTDDEESWKEMSFSSEFLREPGTEWTEKRWVEVWVEVG